MTTSPLLNARPTFDDYTLEQRVDETVGIWQKQYRASEIVVYIGALSRVCAPEPTSAARRVDPVFPASVQVNYYQSLKWSTAREIVARMRNLIERRLYSVDGATSYAGQYAIACVGHAIVILDGFASTESPFWQYVKQNAQAFYYINIPDFLIK